jgi:hypothetical protein
MKEKSSHPSYGLIKFVRGTCGGKGARLFGSSIDSPAVITLSIDHAEVTQEYNRDWHYARSKIVEVDLSPSQYAELLTTMNVGSGVPCTIKYIENIGRIAPPPVQENLAQRTKTDFKHKTAEISNKLDGLKRYTDVLLEGKTVGKGQVRELADKIDMAITEIKHNLPYILEQFEEHTDKMVTVAKAEMDAFVTCVVEKTGLEKLRSDAIEQKSLIGET